MKRASPWSSWPVGTGVCAPGAARAKAQALYVYADSPAAAQAGGGGQCCSRLAESPSVSRPFHMRPSRSPPARRLPERPWKGPGSTEMRPAERSCARWEVKGNWRPSARRRRPLGRPTVPRHLHLTLRAHACSPRAEPGRGDPLSGLLRPIGAEGEACRPRSRAGGWRAVQARRVPGPRAPRPGSCRRRARRVQTIHDFINVEFAILFMLAAHRK